MRKVALSSLWLTLLLSLGGTDRLSQAAAPTLTAKDVGVPSLPGSMTTAGGKITIVGGGNDIWNTSDNFHYAYFKVTGDFDYVVKVEDLQGPDNWSKAELMARVDDGSGLPQGGDPHISNMTTRSGGQNELRPQWRVDRDGNSDNWVISPAVRPTYPNTWLRLERIGSVFYQYYSADGTNWKQYTVASGAVVSLDTAGSNPPGTDNNTRFTQGWASTVLLGLAVTAHNDADPAGATAVFSNLGAFVPVPIAITTQPAATVSVAANSALVLSLAATGDPVHYQWRKDGKDIAGATRASYSVNLAKASDAGTYSVRLFGAGKEVASANSVVVVTPDVTPPTILGALGNPNLTEIVLTFSELLNKVSAETAANYSISTSSGAVNVTAASLSADGIKVTLTTAKQSLGAKHTVNVKNVADAATTPNPVATGSKVAFFPTGKLVEQNGFIVFEAENYDRNPDGIWVKDTTRGNPSGGASVVAPNGAGGNEQNTKLEYDIEFKKAATYVIWYRASGNDGNDDSSWFHIDGERPAERLDGNSAAMTGFSGALDFVWRADSFGGVDPMSVDIAAPGPHVVGLARREDGSFFDKFILTTDQAFTPTGFGPAETREGAPASPTITLTAPTAGQSFTKGANVTLTANATTDSRVDIVRVEFQANGKTIGEDTTAPFSFTWSNVADGIYSVAAKVIDELNASATSATVGIAVVGGAAKQFQQDTAGFAVMEAENFDALTPAPDGHTWTIGAERADFSGTGHVQALPNSGANQNVNPDLLTQSPRLDYNVKFSKSGTHYLWLRGGDPDAAGAGDSVNGGINGINPATALRIDGAPGFNIGSGWNWVGSIQGDTRATIEVPSAGNHVVNIWMREDGFYFDKLIITSDASYTPTGTGPAESARSGGAVEPQAQRALLVVGTDSNPVLNASDAGVKARLESKGWKVTVVQAPAAVAADGDVQQLIIVSSTVNSGDVANKFQRSAVPVLNWEQAVQDNFLMTLDTATDHATLAGQTQVNIVKTDHPLAAGLSTGVKTMTTEAQDYSLGVPNANATIIATIADNPAQAVIYGYDKGALLADGKTPAPARRVMFFWGNNGFAASTGDAIKLFDAAVEWASGIKPSAGPGAPTLSLARSGAGLSITFTGTLQSADSVTGPWADVTGAISPLAVTPAPGSKLYRAKQ